MNQAIDGGEHLNEEKFGSQALKERLGVNITDFHSTVDSESL
jgi:hypothetical protein